MQNTAYEMRISDWSSDVCSSDLRVGRLRPVERQPRRRHRLALDLALQRRHRRLQLVDRLGRQHRIERSEEHTSELQSLMRISYAVFFLKKNTKLYHHPHSSSEVALDSNRSNMSDLQLQYL